MQTDPEHSQALDQLQREVNLILEHTGRFFASIGKSPEEAARASRLKQQLSASDNRFHEALDILDEELQTAKAVMRRDLALAREREGKRTEAKAAVPTPTRTDEEAKPLSPELQGDQPQTNSSPQPPVESDLVTASEAPEISAEKSPEKRSSTQGEDAPSGEPSPKRQALGDEKPGSNEAKAADSKLQVDTKPQVPEHTGSQPDEDSVPNTGTFSNNADTDSLFNDQASIGGNGGGGGTDSGDGTGFNADENANNDFDFGSFNASLEANMQDNDNSNDNADVSALLPGLQDYANNSTTAEQDYSSFFQNDPPADSNEQTQGIQDGGDDSNIFQDPVFDEFMDMNMTFDMSGGDGNEDGVHHFNFDE